MATKHYAICTHHIVDRVSSFDTPCSQCYQTPALGILYACRQDENNVEPTYSSSANEDNPKVLSASPSNAGFASASDAKLRSELREIGLSEAVIKLALAGGYTSEQLEKIKKQKLDMRRIIEEELGGSAKKKKGSVDSTKSKTKSSPSSRKTDGNNEADTDQNPNRLVRLQRKTPTGSPCFMKFCVRCKPYFRDKSFMSFDAVFAGEVRPLDPIDTLRLRILKAPALAKLDPYVTTSSTKVSPHMTEYTDCLTSDSQLSTSTSCYESGSVDDDYGALEDVNLEPLRSPASMRTSSSNAGSQSSSSSNSGTSSAKRRRLKTAVRYLHNKLGRKIPTGRAPSMHHFQDGAEASEVYAAEHGLVELDDVVPGATHDGGDANDWVLPLIKTSPAENSIFLPHESDDDEVHVGGGVAVTEFAVTTHTPDIITQA